MPARAKRRPGRPPGESQTRDAILAAARTHFAEHGWKGATLRAIARDAGVDPTLVLHYFGSKRVLFTSAMEWPFDQLALLDQVVAGPRSELGQRLASFFVSVWEDRQTRGPIMAMLRASTTDPEAAAILRETLAQVVLEPVGELLGPPDGELRMSLCSAQLVGAGIARYAIGLEPLASLDRERFARLLAPSLQHYMTGDLDG